MHFRIAMRFPVALHVRIAEVEGKQEFSRLSGSFKEQTSVPYIRGQFPSLDRKSVV